MRFRKILWLLAMILVLTACAGKKEEPEPEPSEASQPEPEKEPESEPDEKNTVFADASPETSALGIYRYDGGSVLREYVFENRKGLVDKLSEIPGHPAPDWTIDLVSRPIYGFEILRTDGTTLMVAWSGGYWILPNGEAYTAEFDPESLLADYPTKGSNSFSTTSVLPSIYAMIYDGTRWRVDLMTRVPPYEPVEGIQVKIEEVHPGDETITVQLTNDRNGEYTYGHDFGLEIQVDGEWYERPPVGPMEWPAEEMVLPPGESRIETLYIDAYHGLDAGHYRLDFAGIKTECTVAG